MRGDRSTDIARGCGQNVVSLTSYTSVEPLRPIFMPLYNTSYDSRSACSELEIPAMRLGPGKHLKGRKLMGGLVTPEGFDYFHEVRVLSSMHSP